jgi:hypothetical protein
MGFYDIYGRLIPGCFLELDYRMGMMEPISKRAFGKLLEDEMKKEDFDNDYD